MAHIQALAYHNGQQRETEEYVGRFLLGVRLYFLLVHPFLDTLNIMEFTIMEVR